MFRKFCREALIDGVGRGCPVAFEGAWRFRIGTMMNDSILYAWRGLLTRFAPSGTLLVGNTTFLGDTESSPGLARLDRWLDMQKAVSDECDCKELHPTMISPFADAVLISPTLKEVGVRCAFRR